MNLCNSTTISKGFLVAYDRTAQGKCYKKNYGWFRYVKLNIDSAFLINAGLDKTAYIATGVFIACMVDLTRLPLYFARFEAASLASEWRILLLATLSAFAGAWVGNRYLKKVTYETVQLITATFMLVFAVLLGIGVI